MAADNDEAYRPSLLEFIDTSSPTKRVFRRHATLWTNRHAMNKFRERFRHVDIRFSAHYRIYRETSMDAFGRFVVSS